jgi:tryptophanyl-tRNA synthetase
VAALLTPVRERYLELRADPAELRRLLGAGADRAREAAAPTLERMYDAMGFVRLA